MWLWLRRNSLSSTLSRLLSGTNTTGRMYSRISNCSPPSVCNRSKSLASRDAENLIAILADDRKARVAGLDHQLDQLLRRLIALDEHHLRARHHDVAHLHVGNGQYALEHDQRVAVE